jgi:hypothetical protein
MAVKKFNCGQSAGKISNRRIRIPTKIGYYLSGFTDGEGSFNVSVINRQKDYKHGWKVSLSFSISQKDKTILFIFRKILRCGTIRYRKDGICYFEVRTIKDIIRTIIPFFKKFPLISESKKKQFEVFCCITQLVEQKQHLEKKGMRKILKLRNLITVGRRRKYSNKQILHSY